MMADKTFYIKKDRTIFSSNTRSEFRKNFDFRKKYKNLFRENIPSASFRKLLIKGPNLYKSFINSSAPYNYFKIPNEENAFLVCFNGGPKIYTYAEKNKLNEELDEKEIIYGDKKKCGCFTKLYVPKLRRCMSCIDSCRTNIDYFKNSRPKTGRSNPLEDQNYNKIGNAFTPKPIIIKNKLYQRDFGFNKKTDEGDNYNNYTTNYMKKINFENSKDNLNSKNAFRRNKYDTLIYSMSQRVDRKFHKKQIFDNCKPFLQELV